MHVCLSCVFGIREVWCRVAGTAVGDEKFGGVAAVVGCDWLVVNFRRRPLNSGDESLLQIYFYLNSTRELMPLKTKKPVLCFMFWPVLLAQKT